MTLSKKVNAVRGALSRSAAYGLLGFAFRYPDEQWWAGLTDRERWVGWPETLAKSDPELGDSIRRIQEGLFSPNATHQFDLQTMQDTFTRLFGHAVRGACSLYELEYGNSEIFQRASQLADIQGFYSAFGLELTADMHERADHVSVECEFMSVLTTKEAYAIEQGHDEGLEIVRSAATRFIEGHAGRLLPSFGRRIHDADPEGLYGALGSFASRFIRSECEVYDVEAGGEFLELRPVDPEEERVQACVGSTTGEDGSPVAPPSEAACTHACGQGSESKISEIRI